jgi:EAL domain-containing protein (putative c-di-GMP-specific phosphodiesterase class I)
LDRLPLDFLKIDKTFVDHLEAGPQKRAVCGAIVRVAHELGFQVVAEGVETRAQHDHLAQMGCDYVQGYVISKPLPAAEMLAWAKQSQVGAA